LFTCFPRQGSGDVKIAGAGFSRVLLIAAPLCTPFDFLFNDGYASAVIMSSLADSSLAIVNMPGRVVIAGVVHVKNGKVSALCVFAVSIVCIQVSFPATLLGGFEIFHWNFCL